MQKQIADAFGIEEKQIERASRIQNQVPSSQDALTKQMIENRCQDYTTARDNIINLLQDVGQVINGAIDQVLTTPTARMLEVFGNLAKTYTDINKDLISLSEYQAPPKGHNILENEENPNPINNVIFVGTSDSLIDQIRRNIQ